MNTCVKLSADKSTFLASDLRRPRQKEVRHVRRARILYAMGFAADWPVNPAVPNFRAADEPLLAV